MRSGRRLLILSALASASLLVACPGDYVTNPFAPMALELFLAPSVQTIFVPDTIPEATPVRLGLFATTLGRAITTPKGVVWESSDPSVAYLDSSGAIFPAKLGTTEVTARINLTRATSTVVVAIQATRVLITPLVFLAHVDDTLTVTASAVDDAGLLVSGMAYAFSSGDPATATVTRTGNQTAFVRFLRVGTARLNVTSGGHTATSTGSVIP
jgi:hypothetical protein